ncbi:hypothetical protein DFH09DRAFT_1277645, partial [Mycena vulgaris]
MVKKATKVVRAPSFISSLFTAFFSLSYTTADGWRSSVLWFRQVSFHIYTLSPDLPYPSYPVPLGVWEPVLQHCSTLTPGMCTTLRAPFPPSIPSVHSRIHCCLSMTLFRVARLLRSRRCNLHCARALPQSQCRCAASSARLKSGLSLLFILSSFVPSFPPRSCPTPPHARIKRGRPVYFYFPVLGLRSPRCHRSQAAHFLPCYHF